MFSNQDLLSAGWWCQHTVCVCVGGKVFQWDCLHGLLESVIYGGRVDNVCDLRVLRSYLHQFFSSKTFTRLHTRTASAFPPQINLPNSCSIAVSLHTHTHTAIKIKWHKIKKAPESEYADWHLCTCFNLMFSVTPESPAPFQLPHISNVLANFFHLNLIFPLEECSDVSLSLSMKVNQCMFDLTGIKQVHS